MEVRVLSCALFYFQRIIPIPDNLRAWLVPLPRSGEVVATTELHREVTALAKRLGIGWPRDVLRHSFISYRIAIVLSADQIALESGNSPAVIFTQRGVAATACGTAALPYCTG